MLAHAGAADESLSVVLLFTGLWVGWAGWSRLKGRGFPRLPSGGAVALIVVGVALAVSAAVVPRALFPPTSPGLASPTPGGPRPASTATLSFVEPAPNQEVTGDTLQVVLDLEGGRIVDTTSMNLTPDTGHIHLLLDGSLVSMTYGSVQEVDLRGLAPGDHRLEADFVAADHGPFDPQVRSSVEFRSGGGGA
jgi:hypothetical protein